MLVCVSTHTHTQQSLSSRSLAYSGSEVFIPIVMSLANDSIWYLISKILKKKKNGTRRGEAQLLFLAVQWSPARNFNSHYFNFLKVNNKSDYFVVLISMLHEYVSFSNVVMYTNPTVNSLYVNISLMTVPFLPIGSKRVELNGMHQHWSVLIMQVPHGETLQAILYASKGRY